jgi:hypothetical protein
LTTQQQGTTNAEAQPQMWIPRARCLEKNPVHRLHDIADARIEIQEAIRDGAT